MKTSITFSYSELKKLVSDLAFFMSSGSKRVFSSTIADHMKEKCAYHIHVEMIDGYNHELGKFSVAGKAELTIEVIPKPEDEYPDLNVIEND